MTELAIARLLIAQHEGQAIERSLDRLRERVAVGDMEGCAQWARVLAALNRLQGEAEHGMPR
ncbi:MAG TPA: hypothetical protein VG848_00110 [Acetobacteraceae bacterium]|nr:hypothetical protein [Acetobacteraceae bacterium]